MTNPQICDSGKICDVPGLNVPRTNCPAGYYCKQGTSINAINPSNDTTLVLPFRILQTNTTNTTTPVNGYYLCPLGYQCPTGTGEFGNTQTLSPSACSINKYGNVPGLAQCLDCSPGYECSNFTKNTIQYVCPSGTYRSPNDNQCQKCPKGTYQNITGAPENSSCIICPVGYICDKDGMSTFINTPCDPKYQCTPGTSVYLSQNLCPDGYYCSKELGTQKCPLGKFCASGTSLNDSVLVRKSICDKVKFCNYNFTSFFNNLTNSELSFLQKYNSNFPQNKTLLNPQDINDYCLIPIDKVTICPINSFCPEGTGGSSGNNGPKPCTTGTFSYAGADSLNQCILKPTDRYSIQNIYQISLQSTTLNAFSEYDLTFNRTFFEKNTPWSKTLNLGVDYDIKFTFSIDTYQIQNLQMINQYNLLKSNNLNIMGLTSTVDVYFLENISKPPTYVLNIAPISKLPLLMEAFTYDNQTSLYSVKFFKI